MAQRTREMLALAILLAGVVVLFALTGCAGYRLNDRGGMDSYGFLRTLTVKEVDTFDPSGKLIRTERIVSTASNTSDILCGLNEVVGTATGAAGKAIP